MKELSFEEATMISGGGAVAPLRKAWTLAKKKYGSKASEWIGVYDFVE